MMSPRALLFETRKNYRVIAQTIKESDWVIIRAPSIIAGMAAALARRYSRPYVIELVGCPWDSLWNHSFRGKMLAPAMWWLTRRLLRHASNAIYVTQDFLQKRYPTKGRSIGCSDVALPGKSLEEPGRVVSDHKHRPPTTPLILGTLAAIDVKYKGHQYVIQALGHLKNHLADTSYEYHAAGRGNPERLHRLACRHGVENQVKFVGEVPHHMIFDWLDSLDVYVQPSLQEGLPRALIEAMSRGLPACGSSAGGIPELLDESVVFPTGRRGVMDLISLLERFRSDELRHEQGTRNLREATKYDAAALDDRRTAFLEMVYRQARKQVALPLKEVL